MPSCRQTGSPHRRPSGFSLMELMLVMATIGIVAAIAVPRYGQSLSRYRVQLAAQRIVLDLAAAASDADSFSAIRTVSFDPLTHTYRISAMADLAQPASTWLVRLADEPYVCTIESVDLAAGQAITFDGYGAPDGGGTIVLRSGDVTQTIVVDAATGRASVP